MFRAMGITLRHFARLGGRARLSSTAIAKDDRTTTKALQVSPKGFAFRRVACLRINFNPSPDSLIGASASMFMPPPLPGGSPVAAHHPRPRLHRNGRTCCGFKAFRMQNAMDKKARRNQEKGAAHTCGKTG